MDATQIKDSIQAVVDGLTPLANKMGVAVEGLWGWAMKHNYAVATAETVFVILFVIALLAYLRSLRWALGKDKDSYKSRMYDKGLEMTYTFVGLFLLFLLLGAFAAGSGAILRFVSPEWMTATDIANLMK